MAKQRDEAPPAINRDERINKLEIVVSQNSAAVKEELFRPLLRPTQRRLCCAPPKLPKKARPRPPRSERSAPGAQTRRPRGSLEDRGEGKEKMQKAGPEMEGGANFKKSGEENSLTLSLSPFRRPALTLVFVQ